MPKRPAGVEKKNDRWYAHLQYKNKVYTPGKSFKTAAEANLWRIEKKLELESGNEIINPEIRFTDYIKTYLKDFLAPRIKENKMQRVTFKAIEGIFRNAVVPKLGNYRLQDLSPKIMQDFMNSLQLKYSNYHIKNTIIQLKRCLKRAVIWKYLKENPAIDLEIPRIEIEKPTILTKDQLFDLLEAADIREKAIIALGGLAGLRISEILGLQWKNIDFIEDKIYIDKQYFQGQYKKPKSATSKRIIPIFSDLRPVLQEWKLKCPPPKKWLFPGRKECPLYGSSWEMYNFKPLLRQLDLPDVKFHSLRHLFNKMILDAGMPIREAMQILGHSDPKITVSIYDRLSPGRLVEVSRDIKFFNTPERRKKLRKNNL